MPLETEILDEPDLSAGVIEDWDGLAVAAGESFSAPGWALAWWRHAAPAGAAMRVIAVREEGRLIGVAPLWALDGKARSSRYEQLGARLASPTGPVAAAGRELEVAAALARAFAAASPRPSLLQIEGLEAAGWTGRLVDDWPGRGPWVLPGKSRPVPVVAFEGLDYDGWLAGKKAKFRSQARRLTRRLEDQGARFALAGEAELGTALDAFESLHGGRWEDRGGSDALVGGMRGMFTELAGEWLASGRLRIFTLDTDEEPVAIAIHVAAGGQVDGWNSGFDGKWSKLSPSFQLTLFAIEHATGRGDRQLRLGVGGTEYKLRLADTHESVSRDLLVPRGGSYPLQRLRLAPEQARRSASRRLSDDAKARIRGIARRR